MTPKGRFDWERAIIGANGPRNSTTRLVLLVLATHVAKGKAHAWPSVRTLEAETGLSNRSVIDHLEIAVVEGWLRREEGARLPGMRYRGNVYHLCVPPSGEPASRVAGSTTGERPSPLQATGERSGRTGEPGAATGERHAGQLVNVVPRTTLFNRKENSFGDQKAGVNPMNRSAQASGKGVAQWAEELGIIKGIGEHEGAFQARVAAAVQSYKGTCVAERRSRTALAESV